MKKSQITGKYYDEADAVYFSNPIQTQRYLDYLGPEYFLDILWASEKRKDALVFVWKKCPETAKAKKMWDDHEL
jgi:hypothetical protein